MSEDFLIEGNEALFQKAGAGEKQTQSFLNEKAAYERTSPHKLKKAGEPLMIHFTEMFVVDFLSILAIGIFMAGILFTYIGFMLGFKSLMSGMIKF